MINLKNVWLFRMTHIDNIPHILQNGITHTKSINSNPNYTPIGDSSIITRRKEFILENGKKIGDYIPFYFWYKMPMLYVIQNGFNQVPLTEAKDIVYLVCSIQSIIDNKLNFVFTDGHAVENFTKQYTPNEINNIHNIIDFTAVKAKYWKEEYDLDLKRRKEAEFLVDGDIDESIIEGYLISSVSEKDKLLNFGVSESKIYIKPDLYF